MILYNVTVGIDKLAEKDWLLWMSEDHIPKIMATGFFNDFKVFKVLSHEDTETSSYSVQYFSDSLDKIEDYLENHAPALASEHQLRFKDKHAVFRTLLEEVT